MVVHTYFVEDYGRNSLSSTNVLRHYEIPDGIEHRRDDYFSLEKVGLNGMVSDVHPCVVTCWGMVGAVPGSTPQTSR
jgi:hypothetical protein